MKRRSPTGLLSHTLSRTSCFFSRFPVTDTGIRDRFRDAHRRKNIIKLRELQREGKFREYKKVWTEVRRMDRETRAEVKRMEMELENTRLDDPFVP
jgi:hypothetical protein